MVLFFSFNKKDIVIRAESLFPLLQINFFLLCIDFLLNFFYPLITYLRHQNMKYKSQDKILKNQKNRSIYWKNKSILTVDTLKTRGDLKDSRISLKLNFYKVHNKLDLQQLSWRKCKLLLFYLIERNKKKTINNLRKEINKNLIYEMRIQW